MKSRKNNNIALLLCAIAGVIGAHKFYLAKKGLGILHAISFALLVLSHGARPLALLVMIWWIIDMILVSKEVDDYNDALEAEAAPPPPQQQIPKQGSMVTPSIPGGNSRKLQLMRASSLLELNILSAPEFGTLNERIASGDLTLTQDKYRDVLNLRNMKERESIDDFVYEMQKAKILELKYLPGEGGNA